MAEAVRPRVPGFATLSTSTAISYATFHASAPLLPLLLPKNASVISVALSLSAFLFPALVVQPVVSSRHVTPSLPLVLTSGVLLQAAGSLLITAMRLEHIASPESTAIFSETVTSSSMEELPSTAVAIAMGAFFVSGLGAALLHCGLVRLLGEQMTCLPIALRQNFVSVHLSLLELCIASGSILAPVLFAVIGSSIQSVFVPFLLSGVLQLLLGLYIAFSDVLEPDTRQALPTYIEIVPTEEVENVQTLEIENVQTETISDDSMSYGSFPDHLSTTGKDGTSPDLHHIVYDELGEHDHANLYVLRRPWIWVILFTTLLSAASIAFLRPVLTPRVTDDLGGSRLLAASLFSLAAIVGVLSESFATTTLSALLGTRNTLILGLVVCWAGFRLLVLRSWIVVAVTLLVAGGSTSLVMTLTKLAQTTGMTAFGGSNSLSLLSAFTLSVGEIVGTLAAGLLCNGYGSFENSVLKWSQFLAIACMVIVGSCLLGTVFRGLSPLMDVAHFSRREYELDDEFEMPIHRESGHWSLLTSTSSERGLVKYGRQPIERSYPDGCMSLLPWTALTLLPFYVLQEHEYMSIHDTKSSKKTTLSTTTAATFKAKKQ